MRTFISVLILCITGCNSNKPDDSTSEPSNDKDQDGSPATEDCNDEDASIRPGADELCNGVDDDCDGTVDDNAIDMTRYYPDSDGDGYGSSTGAIAACEAQTGYIDNDDDCNDEDASFYPGAAETDCSDPRDYNCDGSTGYTDADGDGYAACTECNDQNSGINPGASETCNDIDDDCDSSIDEDAIDQGSWHPDADQDGYGDENTTVISCDKPSGHTSDASDCADNDYDRNPSVSEVCDANDIDENCNGLVDDADPLIDTDTQTSWYPDNDGDGYGETASEVVSCEQPAGWFDIGGDCNDGDGSINPSAQEVCDIANIDEDCDGLADDADLSVSSNTKSSWYRDYDGDGYGNEIQLLSRCDAPAGYIAAAGDCDDTVNTINPAGTEICDLNDQDEDCDGLAEDADPDLQDSDKILYYLDADGDGAGSPNSTTYSCDLPSGYAVSGTDCNDADSSINPSAQEICDPADVDEDCDGTADNGDSNTVGRITWYPDVDADGYGATSGGVYSCDNPGTSVSQSGDCDDGNAGVNPGQFEVCDALNADEDCSGAADNDDAAALGKIIVYQDNDGDGYGQTASSTNRCEAGNGWASEPEDCNDSDAAINPGGTEVCASGDEDCDGLEGDSDPSVVDPTTWYTDLDGDGYGDDNASMSTACTQPGNSASSGGDCDDGDASFSPGVAEVCGDGLDQDCSLEADDCGVIRNGSLTTANARYQGLSLGGLTGSSVAIVEGVLLIGASNAGAVFEAAPGSGDISLASSPYWTGAGAGALVMDGGGILGSGTAYLIGSTSDQKLYIVDSSSTPGALSSELILTQSSSSLGGAFVWADQGASGQLFVGAPGYNSNMGAVFVLDTVDTGSLDAEAVATYSGSAGDLAGSSVAAVDFNGDGDDDLIVGSPGAVFGFGLVAGVPGPLSGAYTQATSAFSVVGANLGDGLGSKVANAGDIDGDGYEDILIAALSANRVYIIPGNRTGTLSTTTALATLTGSSGMKFGFSIVGSADFNGDGELDIAVGAPDDASAAGSVYLFAGPVSGTITSSNASGILSGVGQSGYSLSVGDADMDGFDDLLVGSISASGSVPVSGLAELLYGAE
jgi:hypothetical protein